MKSTYSRYIYCIGFVGGIKLYSTVIVRNNPCHSKDVLGAFAKLWETTVSFVMSVRLSAWNNSTLTRWILMKFDI
jgi:hypothetical protein